MVQGNRKAHGEACSGRQWLAKGARLGSPGSKAWPIHDTSPHPEPIAPLQAWQSTYATRALNKFHGTGAIRTRGRTNRTSPSKPACLSWSTHWQGGASGTFSTLCEPSLGLAPAVAESPSHGRDGQPLDSGSPHEVSCKHSQGSQGQCLHSGILGPRLCRGGDRGPTGEHKESMASAIVILLNLHLPTTPPHSPLRETVGLK